MPIVTRVTTGTVEIRISDAAQWYWNHIEDKTVIKLANIDFETGFLLTPHMINKLLEKLQN